MKHLKVNDNVASQLQAILQAVEGCNIQTLQARSTENLGPKAPQPR